MQAARNGLRMAFFCMVSFVNQSIVLLMEKLTVKNIVGKHKKMHKNETQNANRPVHRLTDHETH